jgi:hypothetical protein
MADHNDTQRIDGLVQSVGRIDGKLDGVQTAVAAVQEGVGELRSAVTAMARLEVAHTETRAALDGVRSDIRLHEKRIDRIEGELAPLNETRGWVIRWIIGVVTLVGASMVALVLTKG